MFRFLAMVTLAAGLAVTGAACDPFCDDPDPSCGGSPYRDPPSCVDPIGTACMPRAFW